MGERRGRRGARERGSREGRGGGEGGRREGRLTFVTILAQERPSMIPKPEKMSNAKVEQLPMELRTESNMRVGGAMVLAPAAVPEGAHS